MTGTCATCLPCRVKVAQAIAEKIEVTITPQERSQLVAARSVAPEVYESYVKGSNDPEYTKAQIEHRIADFQDAIRMDPTFAPAYVGLAGTYINYQNIFVGAPPSEIRPKATSAARKALELDPKWLGLTPFLECTRSSGSGPSRGIQKRWS